MLPYQFSVNVTVGSQQPCLNLSKLKLLGRQKFKLKILTIFITNSLKKIDKLMSKKTKKTFIIIIKLSNFSNLQSAQRDGKNKRNILEEKHRKDEKKNYVRSDINSSTL